MISPLDPGRGSNAPSPGQSQVIALRVAIIGAVLLGLFAVVFFRLWYLQVLSGNSLAAQATSNRVRTQPITAPRGDILDRDGNKLVDNLRAQIIELAPNSLPQEERTVAAEYGQALSAWSKSVIKAYDETKFNRWTEKGFPDSVRRQFPKPTIPKLNDPKVVQAYADSSDPSQLTTLRQRYQRLGWLLRLPADEVRRRVIRSLVLLPYGGISLVKRASQSVVDYLAENADQFPGVSTSQRFVRSYPHHGVAAQLFGQVGAIPMDPKTGKSLYEKYDKLDPNSQVGINGLELKYDGYLHGTDGQVKTTVDAAGNVIGTPTTKSPMAGGKLQLTLDLGLAERAQKSLGVGSKFNPYGLPGAVVAMDPHNGDVLAMASNPTFDPASFVRGISDKDFEAFVANNGTKPLFNRALQGGYASGSTFKPVTAFAAVADGKLGPTEQIYDSGSFKNGTQTLHNAGGAAYGSVDLQHALVVSSDVFFYTLGARLNSPTPPQPLQQWARKLGFGEDTGIDVPGENPGIVPDTKWRHDQGEAETKCRRAKHIPQNVDVYTAGRLGCGISDKRPWSIGDNVNLAIGQGDVNVTPLQLAVLYAAIENGGTIVRPHLAQAILDRSGGTQETFSYPARRKVDLEGTGALEAVRNGLYGAANEPGGTSQAVFANWPRDRYPIYGKTGTSQKRNAQGGTDDTSWYAAYVPDPHKPIVVVAVVEKGGFGAEKAAPIVGQMLAQWFNVPQDTIKAGESNTR